MRESSQTDYSPVNEYLEAGRNMRQFGNIRFAQLTLFVTMTAVILAAVLQTSPAVSDSARLLLKFTGLLVVVVFWLMDQRAMDYWHHYRHRAIELEAALGYEQYTSCPAHALLSATNAVRLLYLGICAMWSVLIVWGGYF